MRRFFLGAFDDLLDAFHRVMPRARLHAFAGIFLAGALTWWIYVPIHELLHVLGCVATGGTVYRLEIGPAYGAALLAKVFSFVAVGSDYPGQLTGFDTGGSDLIYIVTVFAPYLLTVLCGVPLLRSLGRGGEDSTYDRFLFGASIPLAFAPFMNVLGDFYELASIPLSRIAAALVGSADPARWRSDDLAKLAGTLFEDSVRFSDLSTLSAGGVLAVLLTFATYRLGAWFHDLVSRRGTADQSLTG